ncbi:MAG: ATP-binding protein [Acidobacteriota bacterium]
MPPTDEFPRLVRAEFRFPVRSLIGAVASIPLAFLAVTLVLLVGDLGIGHWTIAAIVSLGLVVSYVVAATVTRRIARRLLELERQRDAFYQEFSRLSKAASLGEIASGVAHDINNPLAVMNEEAGWLRDLLGGPGLDRESTRQEFAASVEQIGVQIKRASSVTRRLLHWARDMTRPSDVIDVNPLLTRTLYLLEGELTSADVRVVTRLDPKLPKAVGSEAEITQVLLHLMKNALDAMKGGGGTLTITTDRFDGLVRVGIADTGPGIPPELVARIFEPFFTTKPVGEGAGLGLAISAWIVQRAGGHIAVDSVPGSGATFHVTLQPAGVSAEHGGEDEGRAAVAR